MQPSSSNYRPFSSPQTETLYQLVVTPIPSSPEPLVTTNLLSVFIELPMPLFLPGEFHGQRSLKGHSPWSCKESDTTEKFFIILDIRDYQVALVVKDLPAMLEFPRQRPGQACTRVSMSQCREYKVRSKCSHCRKHTVSSKHNQCR